MKEVHVLAQTEEYTVATLQVEILFLLVIIVTYWLAI